MIRLGRKRRNLSGRGEEDGTSRQRLRRAAQTVSLFKISPRLTDPEINRWLDSHVVAIDPSAEQNGKLFLFFCGSYGNPERQRLIVEQAARMGYHVINLHYPNSWTVGGLCRNSEDPNCHGKVRLEIVDGVKRFEGLDIGRADSIVNRLEKLLRYLHRERLDEGWSAYFDEDGICWDSIVVSGHSQGGGQAAMIAKVHRVDRVVMFAAPVDFLSELQSHATWLSASSVTPTDRYFGFIHQLDQGFERVKSAWKQLGMDVSGPVVNVDGAPPPYGYAQRLVSTADNIHRKKYHASVVLDNVTPVATDGLPLFEPVWRYLLNSRDSE